jgi:hypothetical protein
MAERRRNNTRGSFLALRPDPRHVFARRGKIAPLLSPPPKSPLSCLRLANLQGRRRVGGAGGAGQAWSGGPRSSGPRRRRPGFSIVRRLEAGRSGRSHNGARLPKGKALAAGGGAWEVLATRPVCASISGKKRPSSGGRAGRGKRHETAQIPAGKVRAKKDRGRDALAPSAFHFHALGRTGPGRPGLLIVPRAGNGGGRFGVSSRGRRHPRCL